MPLNLESDLDVIPCLRCSVVGDTVSTPATPVPGVRRCWAPAAAPVALSRPGFLGPEELHSCTLEQAAAE